MILADLKLAIAVAKMESVALAVAPHFAMGAIVSLHPATVSIDLEFVLPYLPEAILVDVALMVVATYAEAS